MKRNWKGFLAGVLATILVLALFGGAIAAYQKQATLDYTGISITLDGKKITPTDVNGNSVEPFAIDGTTYLPVRAIANALGLGVDWNQSTQTVVLSSSGNSTPTTPQTQTSILPMQITKSGFFLNGEYLYTVTAIHNPNTTYAIEYPSFRIIAKDSDGILLGTDDQTLSIIYPGQTFYFAGMAFDVAEAPATVSFEILPPHDYEIVNTSTLEHTTFAPLVASNCVVRNGDVLGEIKNNNNYDISRAIVVVIFEDESGRIVGGDSTYVESLKASGSIPFEISPPGKMMTKNFKVYANIW